MTKKSGSRFDDLFGAARSGSLEQESIVTPTDLTPTQKPLSKSTDPDYIRTTVYLPKQLHKQLKTAAADEERDMSEIAALAIARYLEERKGKPN